MKKIATLIAAGCLMWTSGAAHAEDDKWKFEVTPYAWLVGLEGDFTVAGRKVDFDKSFSDLFDAVEIGGSVRMGAEKNRIVVGGLIDYFSLSTDELDVDDQPQRGSVDSELLLTEAGLGYRIDGWAEGQTFVFMAGVRNLHIDNDLTVYEVGKFGGNTDITDAMLYVLPSVPLFSSKIDGLRFNPVLGIGAGDSDLAYEFFPQLQYRITENMAARLGYRTVGWEYKGDNALDEINLDQAGLIIGLGWVY